MQDNCMNKFYNYIYLDPRKPGHYTFNNISFLYEPFYVGKGKNNRYLDHIKYDKRNTLKNNVVNKILDADYDLEKFVIILSKNLSEEDAFNNEIDLIKMIGRRIDETGSLCNMDEGGKGSDNISHHPDREKIIKKSTRSGEDHHFYHKTYKEIYGDKAEEQKEKRRQALLGKKHTKERCKNISKSSKGKIPWNKGLDINDPRVAKYIKNKKPKAYLKQYSIKNEETGEHYVFNGKNLLEDFLKEYNKEKKRGFKINSDVLIKEGKNKNFIILNKELNNGSNRND